MAKGKNGSGRFRSAISGRFVTTQHGRASTRTTVQKTFGGGNSGGRYRSAVSGRYVTAKHGKASPNTTVKES